MSTRLFFLVFFALFLYPPTGGQAQDAAPPVVEGTLTGHDDSALSTSHVHVRPYQNERTRSIAVGPDRSFRAALDTTGIVELRFTGHNHSMQERTVVARRGDTIGVDVRLGTFARPDTMDLQVVGAFNDFSSRSGTVPMTEQANGTYAATVPSPGDSLTYGVLGARPDGTQLDRLTYAGGGNYRPVVAAPDDSTQITYDPAAIPRSDTEPSVQFRDPAVAQYASFAQDVITRMKAFQNAMRAADNRDERMAVADTFDWSPNRKRLREALQDDLPLAVTNAYRTVYLASTLDPDSTVAKKMFATVSASSPLWSFGGGPLFRRALYSTGDVGMYEDYAYEVLRETPSDDVRVVTLTTLLRWAAENEKKDKKNLLYAWIQAEHSGSRYARIAKAQYAPDRAVEAGKPVPDFEVEALRDTTTTFTPASFEGQYVLLDFWATWCGPCIDELPTLRAADSTYSDTDFTILSLSLDASRSTVTDFLEDRKMPWKHAFADGGFDSEVAGQFEIVGIPKPVLVGPEGQIVATRSDLMGEDLLATLEKHLGPPDDATEAEESN